MGYILYFKQGHELLAYHEANKGGVTPINNSRALTAGLEHFQDLNQSEKSQRALTVPPKSTQANPLVPMNPKCEGLKTWTGFIKYEIVFLVMMFFELLWCRLDTVIASIFFNEVEVAAQSAFST